MLLSFLRIRAIVNGKQIYPLPNSKPVAIRVDENNPKLIISDGFHFTKPINRRYDNYTNMFSFNVVCVISDMQLVAGGLVMSLLYLLGFYSGFLVVKLFSFLPILYFLFFYYINRKDFLQLIRAPLTQTTVTGRSTRS